MKEFTINTNDGGQRLDRFLSKAVPRLPSSLMQKYLRTKRIKRNGKRAAPADRLEIGDVLQLYVNDEFFETGESTDLRGVSGNIDVIYEDRNILIVNKPAGLLCHSDKSEGKFTLVNMIIAYLINKGEFDPEKESSFTPALCNRIDRNTCGLVLAAKNAEALRIMCEKIKQREVKKYYRCVVFGRPEPAKGEYTSYLSKDGESNTVRVSEHPFPGALTAISRYKTLRSGSKLSLLEVELITGRTHQIRAQFASKGHPLLGDGKYGNAADSKPYGFRFQALQSHRVVFDFQTDAGILNYLNSKAFELDSFDAENFV